MTAVARSRLFGACLGNLFEHYDTALFGLLSPFLAPLFFPEQEPLTALILTYAMIPLGMLARPLGAAVFGYLGDVRGRGYALFWTLAGMGVVSGCMALNPTYLQAGLWAPLLFCCGRALQNFFAAGETMGGALFLLENSPEKRRDVLSGLYSASTMAGHLLASLAVYWLSRSDAVDPGWRLLYLYGCTTALFGCFLRRSAPSLRIEEGRESIFAKIKPLFSTYRKPFLLVVLSSGFATASYSIALVFMNGFVPLVTSLTKAEVLRINTYLLVFDFCALPFFGWLASKVSRERLMLSASLGAAFSAIPLSMLLEGASAAGVIGVRIAFVIFGVAFFAPFHAWASQLFPPAYRYAAISLGYALGYQLLGSPSAAIALWCFQKTGIAASVCGYWILLALAGSLAIALSLPKKLPIFLREKNEL